MTSKVKGVSVLGMRPQKHHITSMTQLREIQNFKFSVQNLNPPDLLLPPLQHLFLDRNLHLLGPHC